MASGRKPETKEKDSADMKNLRGPVLQGSPDENDMINKSDSESQY